MATKVKRALCDNFKGIRENCEIRKHENGKPKSCMSCNATVKARDSERARSTPGHSYKSETDHFYDNFKGIRENSEIPKLHEKGKPKFVCPAKSPVTVRDSGKARCTPLGVDLKVYNQL
ncbi:hypothetical protein Fcan01_28616 [Folsomia candida]|uniref:Uncharacterized protein n=1 Tax=Folsomia candida TaxID=158441 RepID=A0A226CUP5_FOLCA|nr:hypothetical protein Fcan01_28616 [Folsomia candida]